MTATVPVLRSDCSACFGLCCVLLPFAREAGFGVTKPGGTPCHHLDEADACGIHANLRPEGWPGCTVFECFGAGQQVSQVTYRGVSWRDQEDLGEMGAVLSVMRSLHEMLAHLTEALERGAGAAQPWLEQLARLTAGTPEELLTLDLDLLREQVGDVLADVSRDLRTASATVVDRTPCELARADLAGRDLRPIDLRAGSLRGALLIRADLRGSDLTDTDLLGADLRDADVRGARLTSALFLAQPQVNAARGDAATHLPPGLVRPSHWAS